MNYLPVIVESDIIFRENSWRRQFTFNDPSYLTGKSVHIAFWVGNRIYNEPYEITPSGGDVVLSLTADEVRSLPAKFEYYLLIDDDSICGGNVSVRMGTGSNTSGVTQITINGDHVTTIQIPGYSVVSELVQQAEEARDEARVYRDEVVGVAARKIDNWQVDTKADADSFALTLENSAFIEVLADETQSGIRALYFWNTIILQEPLLL